MVSHGPERKSPFGVMPERGVEMNMCVPDFPLTSPRHLRRPFSAATGSGRFAFSRAAESNIQGVGAEKPKRTSMGAAVAHPISPELVLVCPELREHALTLLPAVDPEELFAVEPRPAAAPPPVAAPVPERPQLALVEPERIAEPERRAPLPLALVAYLTEAIFLGAMRGAALTALIVVLAFVLAR
jgi:hypothetical protein